MRLIVLYLLVLSSVQILLSTEEEMKDVPMQEQPLVLVDTADLQEPQGNWLFKRHWWKRANKIYDQLTASENEIFDLRGAFMHQRTALEQDLFDPFYMSIGITQGELRALISYLIEQLERTDEQEFSEKERMLLGKLQDQKESIMQINSEIQEVSSLDHDIDTAIATLIEQLNLVRGYKQQAWALFKAIERELSDQRARELVFEMRALQKNINDIKSYLEGSFTQFFDSLSAKASQEVDRLQALITQLKEKGIDLKAEAQELELIENNNLSQEPAQPQGIFYRFWSWLKSLFGYTTV